MSALTHSRDWPRSFHICGKGTSPHTLQIWEGLNSTLLVPALQYSVSVSVSLQTYRQPWPSQDGRTEGGRSLPWKAKEWSSARGAPLQDEGRWKHITPGVLNRTCSPFPPHSRERSGGKEPGRIPFVSPQDLAQIELVINKCWGLNGVFCYLINCQKVTIWVKQQWSAPQISHP